MTIISQWTHPPGCGDPGYPWTRCDYVSSGAGLTPCAVVLTLWSSVRPSEVDEVDWRLHRGDHNWVSMTKGNR